MAQTCKTSRKDEGGPRLRLMGWMWIFQWHLCSQSAILLWLPQLFSQWRLWLGMYQPSQKWLETPLNQFAQIGGKQLGSYKSIRDDYQCFILWQDFQRLGPSGIILGQLEDHQPPVSQLPFQWLDGSMVSDWGIPIFGTSHKLSVYCRRHQRHTWVVSLKTPTCVTSMQSMSPLCPMTFTGKIYKWRKPCPSCSFLLNQEKVWAHSQGEG